MESDRMGGFNSDQDPRVAAQCVNTKTEPTREVNWEDNQVVESVRGVGRWKVT